MTTSEFKRVLLEGLRQTQDTRATFYRHQAKEKDIEPVIFLNGLREEYNGLFKIVDTVIPDEMKLYYEDYGDPTRYIFDVFGTIGNIGINKTLHRDNIVSLLWEPLNEFERSITEKQEQTAPDQQEPTAPVKALFIYYLSESKEIRFPQRGDFKEILTTYHFTGSHNHVYNAFLKLKKGSPDIMNIKNLKSVIKLLSPYPMASRKADNDLYEIEKEARQAPGNFS